MEKYSDGDQIPEEETWSSFSTVEIEWDIDDSFGCFGFRDQEGNIRIEPQFLSVGEFRHGLCPVALGKTWYRTAEGKRHYEMHWGYINKTGKVVIPFKYREAWSYNKYGIAVVCDEYTEDGYMIDLQGMKIENSSFPYVSHYYDYDNRFIEVASSGAADEGSVGLYDTRERKMVYPLIADSFMEYDENCILVDESFADICGLFKQHYINADGEELYPWLVGKGYDLVDRPNKEGLAIVAIGEFYEIQENNHITHFYHDRQGRINWLYGVAGKDGELIIPAEYDSIKDLGNGCFECQRGNERFSIEITPDEY